MLSSELFEEVARVVRGPSFIDLACDVIAVELDQCVHKVAAHWSALEQRR